MSDANAPLTWTHPVYPPTGLGQRLWKIGVDGLELIRAVQVLDPLTEERFRWVVGQWEVLRPLLQHDLDWWVADDAPHFEPTASSHFEAIFRRLERVGRYACYAGTRFEEAGEKFPPERELGLDYELATAFVLYRIERIDLATAATGLRKEVVRNMTRPMCRLSWERACVGEWRLNMYMDMLMAAPACHWQLDHAPLLHAIRSPPERSEGRPRLAADPDTRAVFLDGRQIASGLPPDVFGYVAAVIAAHPHPIPFKKIQAPGISGKNQTRLRGRLKRVARRLWELIEAGAAGHYLKLPPPK